MYLVFRGINLTFIMNYFKILAIFVVLTSSTFNQETDPATTTTTTNSTTASTGQTTNDSGDVNLCKKGHCAKCVKGNLCETCIKTLILDGQCLGKGEVENCFSYNKDGCLSCEIGYYGVQAVSGTNIISECRRDEDFINANCDIGFQLVGEGKFKCLQCMKGYSLVVELATCQLVPDKLLLNNCNSYQYYQGNYTCSYCKNGYGLNLESTGNNETACVKGKAACMGHIGEICSYCNIYRNYKAVEFDETKLQICKHASIPFILGPLVALILGLVNL